METVLASLTTQLGRSCGCYGEVALCLSVRATAIPALPSVDILAPSGIEWCPEQESTLKDPVAARALNTGGRSHICQSQRFGRPRRADHLRSGVRDQPGQQGKTLSLLKILKLAGHGGGRWCSQLLGKLRRENRLNLGDEVCSKPRSPVHSSLGDRARLCLKKKKKKMEERQRERKNWMGFHHIGQAGLELPTSGDSPALASKGCPCSLPSFMFLEQDKECWGAASGDPQPQPGHTTPPCPAEAWLRAASPHGRREGTAPLSLPLSSPAHSLSGPSAVISLGTSSHAQAQSHMSGSESGLILPPHGPWQLTLSVPQLPCQSMRMTVAVKRRLGQAGWLTPVIPALWDTEVGGSQGQEFETSLANMVWWHPPVIPATWEAEAEELLRTREAGVAVLGRLRRKNDLNPGGGGCTTREAEAGESLEPRRRRLHQARGKTGGQGNAWEEICKDFSLDEGGRPWKVLWAGRVLRAAGWRVDSCRVLGGGRLDPCAERRTSTEQRWECGKKGEEMNRRGNEP
ncbi:hypothetical protein AAY473_027935 [Plecturocebus cupreus]